MFNKYNALNCYHETVQWTVFCTLFQYNIDMFATVIESKVDVNVSMPNVVTKISDLWDFKIVAYFFNNYNVCSYIIPF